MVNKRNQIIITLITTVALSILAAFLWYKDIDADYGNLNNSIFLIFANFLGFVLGLIALILRGYKKLYPSSYKYNFIGTYNIYIGILGLLFLYYDSGKKISSQMIMFIIPILIGNIILTDVYIRKVKK